MFFLVKISAEINRLSIFLGKKSRGVTPIIATILILALVVAGVVIGFTQIVPYIERSKVETGAASIESSLIKVDNVIWDLISDSAGNYIADSVPSRKLQIDISIGTLSGLPTRNTIIYEPIKCPAGVCPAINPADPNYSTGTYGSYSHSFQSNYVLLPENTIQYLTGSNPYQRRDVVAYSSLTTPITSEQSPSNISIYRKNVAHYIELSYRPKIFVTQTIENGLPTYNIGIVLIKLQGTTSFIGTTNMFLKYSGASIKEAVLTGVVGDTFNLYMSVDGNAGTYASFSASTGGFTTMYKVTAITHVFTISE